MNWAREHAKAHPGHTVEVTLTDPGSCLTCTERAPTHDTRPSPPSPYQQMKDLGASDAVIAAYDILADDGMPPEQAAKMVVAAERSGRDAEAFARHVVKLRKAMR